MKRALIALALAMVTGLALFAWLRPDGRAQATAPPLYKGQVIAKVAGEPIYLEQAAFRAQGVESAHQLSALGRPNRRSPWPKLILQSLADDVIIRNEMAKQGVSVSPARVAQATATYMWDFGGPGPFQKYLTSSNLTLAQFQARAYMNLLGAAAYLRVTDGITVPESEIRAVFRKNPKQFPGLNRALAYAQARSSIQETLLKQKKDNAFQTWLDGHEDDPSYSIDVMEANWWQQIADQTPPQNQSA